VLRDFGSLSGRGSVRTEIRVRLVRRDCWSAPRLVPRADARLGPVIWSPSTQRPGRNWRASSPS